MPTTTSIDLEHAAEAKAAEMMTPDMLALCTLTGFNPDTLRKMIAIAFISGVLACLKSEEASRA